MRCSDHAGFLLSHGIAKLLTFRLPGFVPLIFPLKVAKLVSCIMYQLYTKFMSEVKPIYKLSGRERYRKKFYIVKFFLSLKLVKIMTL